MTDETQVETPIEDAPVLADSSPAPEETPVEKVDDANLPPRDDEGKFLSPKAQKRIDELTWKAAEREREAAYWRELAMQKPPEPPKEPPKAPTLEQVGYDETKFQAAFAEYARAVAREEAQAILDSERKEASEKQRLESFTTRQREFAKATPDFEDKVLKDPTLPITAGMRDVIVDSESGPEIAYYLASNREVAEQIARLPVHLAALEMGRIEGRLAAQKEATKRSPVSKAPPPPPKVDEAEVEVEKDPDKMSIGDWLKWREKELRKKAASYKR